MLDTCLATNSSKEGQAHIVLVQRVMHYLKDRHHENHRLSDILRKFQCSKTHLYRCFRMATGLSPKRWLLRYRLELAKQQLLQRQAANLLHLALDLGFSNQSHFSREFKRHFGVSPRHFSAESYAIPRVFPARPDPLYATRRACLPRPECLSSDLY